jgi:hypothetical protein
MAMARVIIPRPEAVPRRETSKEVKKYFDIKKIVKVRPSKRPKVVIGSKMN